MNTPSENVQNELLRRYLNRITMQLMFGVPRTERRAIREEVTQHLTAMIADETVQGRTPEEAVRAALHRFGDPRKVGKDLRRRWIKKHPLQREGNSLWNWRQFWIGILIQVLWMVPCMIWFPAITDGDRQYRYSLFLAALHGGMYGALLVISINLFIRIKDFRVDEVISRHFLTDMGDTLEQQTKTFVEEMGSAVTPESIEKTRILRRSAGRIIWVISILFWGGATLALYFVVMSQSIAYEDKAQWCYRFGEFAAIGLFSILITSRFSRRGRRKISPSSEN